MLCYEPDVCARCARGFLFRIEFKVLDVECRFARPTTTNWFRSQQNKNTSRAQANQCNFQHPASLNLFRSQANALAHRSRMAWTEWKVTKINTKSTSFPLKYISCWVQHQTPDTGDCGLCISIRYSDTTTIWIFVASELSIAFANHIGNCASYLSPLSLFLSFLFVRCHLSAELAHNLCFFHRQSYAGEAIEAIRMYRAYAVSQCSYNHNNNATG